MKSRSWIVVVAAVALTVAFPTFGRADDKDKDKDKKESTEWLVFFGQPQPQSAPNAVTHFLQPDDLTIRKGDRVNFVVNGGGHGIAIHPVSKKTTRDDIAADLCQGPADKPESDRAARATVCNGATVTVVTVNGTSTAVTGTQNLDYTIDDAKEDVIIRTGFNLTAANSVPPTVIDNPRVDDTEHTHRLLGTSGRSNPADTTVPGASAAGAFLAGSAPATPGNRINVQFLKTGRYLVICMNRGHSLNDHMFGFVSVTDDDDDDKDKDK